MTKKTFRKILSANDVGATGGHQCGIHIPKSEKELLSILPSLDPAIKNPDAWIEGKDERGVIHRFRFVYYNNKLHDPKGTRNEYRLTNMSGYLKEMVAREGASFEISKDKSQAHYEIRVVDHDKKNLVHGEDRGIRIKIRSGWRRSH